MIMTFKLDAPTNRRIVHFLLAIIATLIVLSVLGQVSKYFLGHPRLKGMVPTFYVDNESNVPTWYSSLTLFFAAVLFAIIGSYKWSQRDAYRVHWMIMGCLFMLLSLDEIAMFHELPIAPMREAYGTGGVLYYGWVIPGVIFVLLVGILSLRWLIHLPRRTAWGIVAAGAIFVFGAIGIEMLSGAQADARGEQNFTYSMIVTVEELFEMLGVWLLIKVLLDYIVEQIGEVRLTIGSGRPATIGNDSSAPN